MCKEGVCKPKYLSVVLQWQLFLISSPWAHAGNVLEKGMRCFIGSSFLNASEVFAEDSKPCQRVLCQAEEVMVQTGMWIVLKLGERCRFPAK